MKSDVTDVQYYNALIIKHSNLQIYDLSTNSDLKLNIGIVLSMKLT
jgi:hypothetical protein